MVGLPAPSLVPLASFLIPSFSASVRHALRGRRALSVRSLVASARARRWLVPGQRPARELDKTDEFYWLVLGILLVFTAWVCVRCLEYGILAAAAVPALVCAALGVRFLRDLAFLKRLGAAAGFERVLDLLEEAVHKGLMQKAWILHDSNLDPLRSKPRFDGLLDWLDRNVTGERR